jgi:hypothetical protein
MIRERYDEVIRALQLDYARDVIEPILKNNPKERNKFLDNHKVFFKRLSHK